jgi:thiamine-monophosphate kinase
MNLRALGEDRLLARLLPRTISKNVVVGIGDDCAAVRAPGGNKLLLLKTDCVVEGIHFDTTADPMAVGWKAMARPLSDFAAVSGVPEFALITLIVPGTRDVAWTKKLYRGLQKAAAKFDVAIVGGETSNTRGPAVVSVSVSGFVEKKRWVSRAGGRPGDALFVTGRLGGSLPERHLRFVPRIKEARWLTRHFSIRAMMDLSDGLGADLPRLARASGCGFQLDKETLPKNRGCTIEQALRDGEDYELLFALPEKQSARLQRRWRQDWPLALTRIGRLTSGREKQTRLPGGYVHFT